MPFLTGRVVDEAELLSPESEKLLTDELAAFERRTGHQLAVLTLPSLEDASLEDFSLKVARTWRLGRAGKNDGVLLLVSRDDRKLRVEVGYGLEGELTDALTSRVIREVIAPRFRSGDYDAGLLEGARALVAAAEGQPFAAAPASPGRDGGGIEVDNDFAGIGTLEKILVSFFVFGILGVFELVGLFAPGAGWFLYLFLIPFWAAFPMAIWGAKIGACLLGGHLLGFPLLKLTLGRSAWGKKISGGFRPAGDGGVVWTGGSRGWSSGSGSSGGGFSGGGGSFGGGGSSGSW